MKAGSAQAESCCVYVEPKKFMQHMHGIIPKLFYCWANPVAHLLLLKSSMGSVIVLIDPRMYIKADTSCTLHTAKLSTLLGFTKVVSVDVSYF